MNHAMKENGRRDRRLGGPRRMAALLTGAALLAAACGGAPHPAAPSANPGTLTAQKLDAYAQCMRTHGAPNFYFTHVSNDSSLNTSLAYIKLGPWAAPAEPSSPPFQSAQNACQHLWPGPSPNLARLQAALRSGIRAAACMRAHGYPNYPDPAVQNGHIAASDPAGVDTSSPRFQAALKVCNP